VCDDLDPAAAILKLHPRTEEESAVSLTRLHEIDQKYSEIWQKPVNGHVSDDSRQLGRLWIAELARETLLSSHGVIVQHTPLFGDDLPLATDDYSQPSQSQPYSSRFNSSQTLPSSIPSSPPSAASTITPDAVFQRLQLLAPSIRPGALGEAKQSSVLDYWPAERGLDTSDYVSSVAVASDKQFEEARQRLRRKTAKRQAQGERARLISKAGRVPRGSELRMESDGFASTPPGPAQIMSSQQQVPASSQSQGFLGPQVTMSQPVSGVFGDRKKVKKGKKRSGFR
jgi:RNA polymerase I-specific transcription initiation factor RRN6